MADNTQVNNGAGDTIRDKDRAGVKTQIVGIDLGIGTGTENLMTGENHLGMVSGQAAVANATYTRPADTTAYAANDAIANSTSAPTVLTFAGMGRVNNGSGYVVKARLLTSQTTNTARLRLHLYKISPTAINDNAACTAPLYADDAKYVGFIDFPACQAPGTGGTAAFAQSDGLRLHFKCDTADTNLYGILQTLDAFTPANAQTFSLTLSAEQD